MLIHFFGLFTIPRLPSIEDNYITLHNFIQILKQNVCPGGCSVLLYWFAKVVHELRLHTSPFFTCLKCKVLVAYLYITELATRTAKKPWVVFFYSYGQVYYYNEHFILFQWLKSRTIGITEWYQVQFILAAQHFLFTLLAHVISLKFRSCFPHIEIISKFITPSYLNIWRLGQALS
jgi:hypothetical protein